MGPGEVFKSPSEGLCVDEIFPTSWAPDGKKLVVAGGTHQENWNLYILELDEDEPFPLTKSDRRDACPAWAAQ